MGISDKLPERTKYLRVILGEVSRVSDHQTCVAAMLMELGAMTAYFYLMEGREALWDLVEEMVGARMTTSWCRIGGAATDIPSDDWCPRLLKVLDRCDDILKDIDALVKRNRIFIDRTQGVGGIPAAEAVNRGWTGPLLRATGVPYDVRRSMPYLVYDRFDFEIPVGSSGDVYDRYLVRMEEMRQSARILRQAIEQLPPGPINIDDPAIVLPKKDQVYYSIEGLISHFKVVMEGIQVPPGEVYSYTEAANGELGFYLVSTGEGRPHKCRVRPPCFPMVQTLPRMVQGRMIADIVPCFGSINMIGGECDR
jgi:NADH-quinone oxidoreductase subunit D